MASRRRTTHRRRRAGHRGSGERQPAAHLDTRPAQGQARPRRDISWMGLIGGLSGVLLLGQAAVYVLVSTDDRLWAVPLFAMAILYAPAIWASLVPTPRRQQVQRGVLALTLVMMVAGAVFLDPAFATLLIVPSTLLAIAGGLVFQGAAKRGR